MSGINEFPAEVPEGHADALNDPARLSALTDSELLDSIPEEAFDRAVRLATRITGTPVGLLSLVDGSRQFFKAQAGLTGDVARDRQTPLSHSFCQYVVTQDVPLGVADARDHPLLRHNLAVDELGVVAYLGVPVRGADGHPLGSFCAIDSEPREWTEDQMEALREISAFLESELELRHAAAERRLLMQELNHRVKNMFAILSGMITMTARTSESAADMAEALRARVQGLARAHDVITPAVTDKPDAGAEVSIQKLLTTLIEPHLEFASDHLVLDGPATMLNARASTSLALAVHEIATNAAKYGSLSVPNGRVEMRWRETETELELDWRESGGPSVDAAAGLPGFGTRLIRMSIEQQLNGRIETTAEPDGMRHRITVPLLAITGKRG